MNWARLAAMLGLACCTLALAAAARAQPGMESIDHAVCRLIEHAARTSHLPVGFLTRVIWRESSFRTHAVSPAGAQGIAQFMPETAKARGLMDPFDPEQAIPKAARLLADLRRRFGNVGLAAAAYNAGAARVTSWLSGKGGLPAETRTYVLFVTDRSAAEWIGSGSSARLASDGPQPAETQSCLAMAAALRRGHEGEGPAPLAPWGVQLAGNFSKSSALASFERAAQRYAAVIGDERPMIIGRLLRSRGTRTFYQVRLPAETRREAVALCERIRGVGGSCVALHS